MKILTSEWIGVKPSCFGIKYAHLYHPLPRHLQTSNIFRYKFHSELIAQRSEIGTSDIH